MRALSLSQPWAWVVVHGGKRVENRTWPVPYSMLGVRFAIHAAKSWDKEAYADIRDGEYGEVPTGLPFAESYDRGAVIGVATVVANVGGDPDHFTTAPWYRWYFGPYGHVLADVRPIRTPVSCRGMFGYWTLPADVEAAVTAQLALQKARLP